MILEMHTLAHSNLIHEGELTVSIQTLSRENAWGHFTSDNEYLLHYAKTEPQKMERAKPLIEFCKTNGIKNILSLGSGESITEITLKNELNNAKLICTDYDPFICSELSKLFTDIDFKVFDMKRDDPHIFGDNFDMVLFCGSDYVMNNAEYLELLSNLNEMGIKYIYIIFSPYISLVEKVRQIAINMLRITGIFVNYTTLNDGRLQRALTGRKKGILHGYSRDLKELNMIYKKSNYDILSKKFGGVSSLKYLPILTASSVDIILEKI